MVRGALSGSDRRARVACRSEHEAAYSFNRYRCTLGKRRFLVRWQQYGSGEYRVSELVAGRSRIIARGIASFGG